MNHELLIGPESLKALIAQGKTRVFDCRFNLVEPKQGRGLWRAGHIPGAAYADLDQDLAAPVTASSGRHPLPEPHDFAAFLARSGWREGMGIVAYDAQGGAFAARLWWLMRYFGHDVVRLLDGGLGAWVDAGGALAEGEETFEKAPTPTLRPQRDMVLDATAVAAGLEDGDILLLDARDADRFAGRTEPIDPVAGHVPGAVNRPFQNNLTGGARFLSSSELQRSLESTLAGAEPDRVVHMCGSGVTACHNQFSMSLAGLPGSRLYAGSWSEWIRDPSRAVERSDT